MSEIIYCQPNTRKDLEQALANMTSQSVFLGGGTDILIAIREKHLEVDQYISLCQLEEMRGITEEEDGIRIGAMATHSEIAVHPLVLKYLNALAMSCDHVGSKQIRNKGTIGGSIGNGSVAGDMLPCLYLFDASIQVLSKDGQMRDIKARNYRKGEETNSLQTGEVIWSILFPKCKKKSCFIKLGPRKEVTIAELSLSMVWEEKDGIYQGVEGVLGAVDRHPLLLEEAGELFNGTAITKEQVEQFSQKLSQRIKEIREKRKRQPKLRIHEWERVYKERAVKGIAYDVIQCMMPQEDVALW